MSIYLEKKSQIPMYLASSCIGNIIIYLVLNSKEFNFSHDMKQLALIALTTVVGFMIGYAIFKFLIFIKKIDKASYKPLVKEDF